MDAQRLKKIAFLAPPLLALAVGAALGLLLRPAAGAGGPDPRAIADRILLSVREEGRMT